MTKGDKNIKYAARMISERECGTQDQWEYYVPRAWEIILLIEQLGFLDKKRFWGDES